MLPSIEIKPPPPDAAAVADEVDETGGEFTASPSCLDELSPAANTKVSLADFILIKVIGKGSYGKVMLVRYKKDNNVYAMKMLRKENVMKRNQVEHTRTERNVLETVSHPFIVNLVYAFQTPKKLYFILEYCPGGELFFHLSRAQRFSENRCRFYASEILLAIEYLHKYDIVYRDLKPENVLLDADGHVKLTDFGLSKEGIMDNSSAKSMCGTPEYLAPEILEKKGHGKAVDWYSLGALMYEMLTGLPPFYTRDREKLFERIRRGNLAFPSYMTPIARNLLEQLLCRDPNKRLGSGPADAQDIKSHPFFQGVDWKSLMSRQITPPFQPHVTAAADVKYFDREFLDMPAINSMEYTCEGGAPILDDFYKVDRPSFPMDNRRLREAIARDIVSGMEAWIYTVLLVSECYPRHVFKEKTLFDMGGGIGCFKAWTSGCSSLLDYVVRRVHLACRGLHEAIVLNRVKSLILLVYENDDGDSHTCGADAPSRRYVLELPSDICKVIADRTVDKHGRNATVFDARYILSEPIREFLLAIENQCPRRCSGTSGHKWKLLFESKPVRLPKGSRRGERVQDRALKVPTSWAVATDMTKDSQVRMENDDELRRYCTLDDVPHFMTGHR
ncbi:hypothetical protein FOL47_005900 [Perkinsus chesapeaki]|uniref:non-specific serine/threonine protein kinase n=1 Tax=Perkinsus chesapeaki TaxID=330153 RepID=A0A7J6LWC8_PERCH|nr:hypothetical protein FOL47_005900 [Perkinsus chesapeaki]